MSSEGAASSSSNAVHTAPLRRAILVKCPTFPQTPELHLPPMDLKQTSLRQLKLLISEQLPHRPTPAEQRIIHAGKLCVGDEQTLDTWVKHADDDVVVFHAIAAAAASPTRPEPSTSGTSSSASTSGNTHTSTASPHPSSNAFGTSPATATTFTSHQIIMGLAGVQAPILVIDGMPYLVMPSTIAAQPLSQVPTPVVIRNVQHVPNVAAAGNAPGQPQVHVFHGPAPAPVNANPGVARRMMQPQDFQQALDGLWTLCKYLFFIYLFSMNASTERWIFMHIVAIVLFLAQTGRLAPVARFIRDRVQSLLGRNESIAAMVQQVPMVRAFLGVVVPFLGTLVPGVEQFFLRQNEAEAPEAAPDAQPQQQEDQAPAAEAQRDSALNPQEQTTSDPTDTNASTSEPTSEESSAMPSTGKPMTMMSDAGSSSATAARQDSQVTQRQSNTQAE